VIFVADASIVRGSLSRMEIACRWITLGARVVVFVPRFNAREVEVSPMSIKNFSGLLISELVEVNLLARDFAGFRVIIDFCDFFGFLSPFRIQRRHDIFGGDRVFFVVGFLGGLDGDLDLLSWLLLALRSASRRGLGGLHVARCVKFALPMETQRVIEAGLEVIELLVRVDVLEMTAQVRDVPIVFSLRPFTDASQPAT
jgi:hypothetical protein